jgi:hypothetical protein
LLPEEVVGREEEVVGRVFVYVLLLLVLLPEEVVGREAEAVLGREDKGPCSEEEEELTDEETALRPVIISVRIRCWSWRCDSSDNSWAINI